MCDRLYERYYFRLRGTREKKKEAERIKIAREDKQKHESVRV